LLAVGQGSSATGYSRVLESILPRIADRFDTVHFAINYSGPELNSSYRVVPNRLPGDVLGKTQLPLLLDQYRPDLVLLFHDLSFYRVHRAALRQYREQNPGFAVVVYCPVEWETTLPGNLTPVAEADCAVFFTEFGRSLFQNALQAAAIACAAEPVVIPHGVDTGAFYPLVPGDRGASVRNARGALFPRRPELAGRFILLNANRNSRRKRIGLTLEVFAEFARDKPDALLYLHMGMMDCGADVLGRARSLGIESRLLVTTSEAERPRITDAHLNLIYNSCDVGINTSTGEGWGLVAVEHAATGAAQIVPDHSACREIWSGHALPIPVNISQDFALDKACALEHLNALYSRPDYLRAYSARALKRARDATFSWDRIAGQWKDVLSNCLDRTQTNVQTAAAASSAGGADD
jgi:glycosyltransferase involved in cell wall biosynthesis